MQIKKLQWINKPSRTKILSSREVQAEADGAHALVYTYDEEQTYSVTFSSEQKIRKGVALILTPSAGFSIIADKEAITIESNILGVKSTTEFKAEESDTFSVEKKDNTLTFRYGDNNIYSFTFENIHASVSIAAIFEGKGTVRLSLTSY